jgi:MFS family permease
MSALAPFSAVSALLAGMFMMVAGNGTFGTLIGVRTAIENWPPLVTGIVMSAYFGGMILGTWLCRPIIERVGHIRAFAAFASLISCVPLLHTFAISPFAWTPLRAVTGFCYAGIYMIAESWLNARATRETRGRFLSAYMIVNHLAQGIGQFVLFFGDPATSFLFGIVSVLLSLAAIPIALTRNDPPTLGKVERLSLGALFRVSPLAMLGAIAAGLVNSALTGIGPIFAHQTIRDTGDVSAFMGAVILGGLIMQWPIGRLSDKYDRRIVIAVTTGIGVLAGLGTILAIGRTEIGVVAGAGLFGGMSLCLYSLCVAHANDFMKPAQRLAASAGLLFVWGFGAIAGPLFASGVMMATGPAGLFYYLIAMNGLLLLFTLWRMTRRRSVPEAERTPFMAVPNTTPKAGRLDPRSGDVERQARKAAQRE